jgi:hypothetical protein
VTTHGYSGKPLFLKLGLKPGMTCLSLRAPAHFERLMDGAEGVRFISRAAPADLVMAFCRRRSEAGALFDRALKTVRPGGVIWMAWPKKRSSLFVDLTGQDFRDLILPFGWVDVKVCAVDDDWSALKFLKRKTSRSEPSS